jgi:FKBP-type peptidyl-prolyl cis-trans isomerase FklB
MKYVSFVLLIFAVVACQGSKDSQVSLKTSQDSLSYSVGLQMGQNLKLGVDDLNTDALVAGVRDGMDDEENLMSDDFARKKFVEFQQVMRTKFQENQQKLAEEGKAKGEVFLEENKNKEGVVTLPSGVQYKIIRRASGPSPKATDQVVVHYRGKLIDGTQFDSSYDRGQPATFAVNQVIKGWTEGLQLMKTGAKWELYIPSELAYGTRGAGQSIPPNSTLIFEVELLEIK